MDLKTKLALESDRQGMIHFERAYEMFCGLTEQERGQVEAVVSGKFAEFSNKLFRKYCRFNELPFMVEEDFHRCIKDLLAHIFEK